MKFKLLSILVVFTTLSIKGQTNKNYVVYFINSSKYIGTPEQVQICDSPFVVKGKVDKKLLAYSPLLTYECGGNDKLYLIRNGTYKKLTVTKPILNLKFKQQYYHNSIPYEYYCLDYLEKKRMGVKVPRYYRGLYKGVVNRGDQIAFNNIQLMHDTTFIMISHSLRTFTIINGPRTGRLQDDRINVYVEILNLDTGFELIEKLYEAHERQ